FVGGILVVSASMLKSKPAIMTNILCFWANWNLKASGIRIYHHGKEAIDLNRQYVILGNHESALDIFVVLGQFPLALRIVSKIELRKLPLVGYAMEKTLFPFVDRKNRSAAIVSLDKTFQKLAAANLSIFLYPEGTRSKTGHLIPFKKGAFVLAIQHQWPILPIVMCGAGKINPPGTIWVKGADVHIYYLPPIESAGLTLDDREELKNRVFELMDTFQRGQC
ncbi:MAG TPA: 1-acyl-sn-glycerol-3-phosphate acyltransferase, partial [Candidatus Marinimicrobia bacterium]|nr:1-acyl-sn-glycerol-3-phosphate acyltransferase [Candidatus Neomarinimicrobiota bacterium]